MAWWPVRMNFRWWSRSIGSSELLLEDEYEAVPHGFETSTFQAQPGSPLLCTDRNVRGKRSRLESRETIRSETPDILRDLSGIVGENHRVQCWCKCFCNRPSIQYCCPPPTPRLSGDSAWFFDRTMTCRDKTPVSTATGPNRDTDRQS